MNMYHWQDNLFFGRTKDGGVRIVKFSAPPTVTWRHQDCYKRPTELPDADGVFSSVEVLLDVRIPAEQWASIVASVSRGSELNGRYYKALDFHEGRDNE